MESADERKMQESGREGGWRGGGEGVHKYSEGDSEVMWLVVIIFIIANNISLCDDVHGGGA